MRWLGLALLLVATTASAKSSNPAFLGVQMNDVGGRGAGPCQVSEVTKDSAAEAAGVQSADIFVTMDGRSIANCDVLVAAIQAKAPGDVVRLVVSRSGTNTTINATLMSRDEILRKRFGGLPVPTTKLVRVDDRAEVDLSGLRRQTTIVGWYPTSCDGCDRIFSTVAKWSRDDKRSSKLTPIKVAAATAGDLRMRRTVKDNLEALKHEGSKLDVPLLVADAETYEQFAIGDGDRVQFMVIDCRGIVQYAVPVVPSSEDAEAVLDELFAAAEQAARKK